MALGCDFGDCGASILAAIVTYTSGGPPRRSRVSSGRPQCKYYFYAIIALWDLVNAFSKVRSSGSTVPFILATSCAFHISSSVPIFLILVRYVGAKASNMPSQQTKP